MKEALPYRGEVSIANSNNTRLKKTHQREERLTISKVIIDRFGIVTLPKKLSPWASAVNDTRDEGTVVPLKLDKAGIFTVFLKFTPYFLLIPLTLTFVSPSTLTLIVSLTRNQVLNTVKASMSKISVNCVMFTTVWEADVVCGNWILAKGVWGSQSSRYITPSKASMVALMDESASIVELMERV